MDYAFRIRYLARAYVDAQNLAVDRQAGAALSARIADPAFVPQGIGEVGANGVAQQRIALFSDSGWQLALLSASFDVSLMPVELGPSTGADFAAFSRTAGRLLSICSQQFGRTPHRLALVQEGLLEEMPERELGEIEGRLLRTPAIYNDPLPFEWDWRCASRRNLRISNRDEASFLISTVKRAAGVLQPPIGDPIPFDRIRVDLDVNTTPQDTTGRFNPDAIADFFERVAIGQHNILTEQMNRFIAGERP
jgi:hypothetical protein